MNRLRRVHCIAAIPEEEGEEPNYHWFLPEEENITMKIFKLRCTMACKKQKMHAHAAPASQARCQAMVQTMIQKNEAIMKKKLRKEAEEKKAMMKAKAKKIWMAREPRGPRRYRLVQFVPPELQ